MPDEDFLDDKDGDYNWHSKNKYARAMGKMKSMRTTMRFYRAMKKSEELAQIRFRRTESQALEPFPLDGSRMEVRGGVRSFDGCVLTFDDYRLASRYDTLR